MIRSDIDSSLFDRPMVRQSTRARANRCPATPQPRGPALSISLLALRLRSGKPAEDIIKTVEEGHFDMLIMGAHGHRGLQDMVHSKTVTAVRHQVKIPVMIVRIAPEEIDRAQQGPV